MHESSDYGMVTMNMETSHHTQGVTKYYYITLSSQGHNTKNHALDNSTIKEVALTTCSQTAAAPTPLSPFEPSV